MNLLFGLDAAEKVKRPDVPRPRVIAIAGGKGGIGKSMLSTAIAMALAESGRRTVLIDGDFGGANLHALFGLAVPSKSLYDFYQRRVSSLQDLAVDTRQQNLRLICGASGTPGMANIRYWEKRKTLNHLQRLDCEFVVLDVGAGMSFNEVDLFNAADVGIIVANPEPPSIQEAFNFVKVALFRSLRREFRDESAVVAALGRAGEESAAAEKRVISEVLEQVKEASPALAARVQKSVYAYRPYLLLNAVQEREEHLDGLALKLAVEDLLGISLEYMGTVPYCARSRAALRRMHPERMLGEGKQFGRSVRDMVKNHLIGEGYVRATGPKRFRDRVRHLRKAPVAPKERTKKDMICAVSCQFWGRCKYQDGGKLCGMPELEYWNRMIDDRRASTAVRRNGNGHVPPASEPE